jgi:hypothetical protein
VAQLHACDWRKRTYCVVDVETSTTAFSSRAEPFRTVGLACCRRCGPQTSWIRSASTHTFTRHFARCKPTSQGMALVPPAHPVRNINSLTHALPPPPCVSVQCQFARARARVCVCVCVRVCVCVCVCPSWGGCLSAIYLRAPSPRYMSALCGAVGVDH